MDTYTILLIVAGGYSILLFFDLFFRSCAHYPYVKLLDALGLRISYFTVKWKTKALNRLLLKWSNDRPQFLRLWFLLGTYISLALLPVSVCILFYSIFQSIFEQSLNGSTPIITPVIPGINLPASEMVYYSVTLLICSTVHEVGHALAAVVEDLGILELGCNIYFILPVAYVSIPTEKLSSINIRKRLGIFCAGVWHNIVLSFIAYLIYCSLPTVFSPLYTSDSGVSVAHISKNSPLLGSKGLVINDLITEINNCKVGNENDWYYCLNNKNSLLPAVCIESDLVNTLDESVPLKHGNNGYVECCDSNNNRNLCFEYIDIDNNELELPGYVCLPGRVVMEKSSNFCTVRPHRCPYNSYCFRPILPNTTYIFKIVCNTKIVIYLGHLNDIYQTVEISSYVRKTSIFPVIFPDIVTKLVKYIIIISLGLAFVNILPVMYMDGEYIFQIMGLILFRSRMGKKKTILSVTIITWMFTITTIFYLLYSVFKIL